MTVDVEDYFQVQALAPHFPKSLWDSQSPRVERNTDRLLSLFADFGVKATFFTLGWVAERYKSLILRIAKEGHELASHGYDHTRADQQDHKTFRADVRRTKQILEDASGTRVRGYRAATFSIGSRKPLGIRSFGRRGLRLQLEHLSNPSRQLRHAKRAALPVSPPAQLAIRRGAHLDT